jgi:hypothetical protein
MNVAATARILVLDDEIGLDLRYEVLGIPRRRPATGAAASCGEAANLTVDRVTAGSSEAADRMWSGTCPRPGVAHTSATAVIATNFMMASLECGAGRVG